MAGNVSRKAKAKRQTLSSTAPSCPRPWQLIYVHTERGRLISLRGPEGFITISQQTIIMSLEGQKLHVHTHAHAHTTGLTHKHFMVDIVTHSWLQRGKIKSQAISVSLPLVLVFHLLKTCAGFINLLPLPLFFFSPPHIQQVVYEL